MRAASAALIALLNNQREFLLADCLTIVPASGAIIRLTSADHDITVASRYPVLTSPAPQTFRAGGMGIGPTFKRGPSKLVTGTEVDKTSVTIFADPLTQHYAGAPWPAAGAVGAFDEAIVVIEKVITASWADLSAGTIVMFWGRGGTATPTRNALQLEVVSFLDLLAQQQLPKNLYQPGCLHTLYDTGCALSKGAFGTGGTVAASPAPTGQVFAIAGGSPPADGYFTQGIVTFATGALAGLSITVKNYAGGVFTMLTPFPSAPAVGDGFTAYPGCDKTQATCSGKFANLVHFRGFPYIPAPSNAL